MAKQTITKLGLAKLLTGTIWDLVKYASWTEFKPLPVAAERRFKVVYWAAWHWGDLIRLFDDLLLASKEAERVKYANGYLLTPTKVAVRANDWCTRHMRDFPGA